MSESIKSLLITMKVKGTPLSTGTAFVCQSKRGPVLLTNRHNVTGRRQDDDQPLSPTGGLPTEVTICHNGTTTTTGHSWIELTEQLYDSKGAPRWVEHPKLGKSADFVALPLTNTSGASFHTYDAANPGTNIAVAPGDVVSVIGFPFGMAGGARFGIWATGFIASEPDVPWSGLPIFLIDCRSRPGQSGSPVVAVRNGGVVPMAPVASGNASAFSKPVSKFMGIYSGRINAESDLGIVWTAAAVAELVAAL